MASGGNVSDKVTALAQDSGGGLWIGTEQGLVYAPKQGEWEIYNTSNSGFPSNFVTSLSLNDEGDLWVGLGAFAFDEDSNAFQTGGLAHLIGPGQWEIFTGSDLPADNVRALARHGNQFVDHSVSVQLTVHVSG